MTNAVKAGELWIGGGHRVSVQSMTNTNTADAEATLAQIDRLVAAGCELVRVAVPDAAAAEALHAIVPRVKVPLCADIHFDHRLAIRAVENGVKKLRINPGNIGSAERIQAVADCAKMHHVPIRIGVNLGSLDKEYRGMARNDPARAMVESALTHCRLFEQAGMTDLVVSMKASNVKATVDAYRRIAKETSYPLHVGVTETGIPELGIIKSAAGIGALLLDGIGDTIRVSLTGDPVREVEAGKAILAATGVRKDDIEIISCPTCGRTRVDVEAYMRMVDAGVRHGAGYLKIAVMGCAVNGIGEAGDADVGVAFGNGNGVLFEHGKQVASGDAEAMVRLLIERANGLLEHEA